MTKTGVDNVARKQRIHYPGAVYHAIARGNNRDNIFFDSNDKRKYLELLTKYKGKYDFQLLAYVLMDNHVHLLVKVNDDPLSKIMQGIQLTYTQYFNQRYLHVGHVFEQRYKAFICEKYEYLMKLLCYIHQNPVRANVKEGINYLWSSHQYYNHGKAGIVTSNFILELFHHERERAIMIYRQLVDVPLVNTDIVLEDKVTVAAPLDLPQVDCISDEYHSLTLDDLAEKLSAEYSMDAQEILGKCRVRKVVKVRNQFIFEAVNRGLASKVELARLLELDPGRITHVYHEMQIFNENKSNFK